VDTKTLCLAVLRQGPASGYEIKKTLGSVPYSHFQDASFGALYPALARLLEEGAISASAQHQEKRPDKKVYSLTEAGHARLIGALMQPPAPDKYRSDFLLVLFLGELLPQDHVMAVIDTRIAELDDQIERLRGCCDPDRAPSHRFVHAFGMAYYQFVADWLRANRDRLATELAEMHASAADEAPERARTATTQA
jgi:DNA-binding PadR family transcriptional regulator